MPSRRNFSRALKSCSATGAEDLAVPNPWERACAVRMQSWTLPMACENTWSCALDICTRQRSVSEGGALLQAAADCPSAASQHTRSRSQTGAKFHKHYTSIVRLQQQSHAAPLANSAADNDRFQCICRCRHYSHCLRGATISGFK